MRLRRAALGAPSSQLTRLLAGDLPGRLLPRHEDGPLRLELTPALEVEVLSRIERRFLGRTEISVFAATFPVMLGEFEIDVGHGGRMRRSGLATDLRAGGEGARRLSEAIVADSALTEAALPLDFTSFVVSGDDRGCRASIELMGASHVSIAFPPIRSYVRLHREQREALVATLSELGRVLAGL